MVKQNPKAFLTIFVFLIIFSASANFASANNDYCSDAQSFSWSGASGTIEPKGDNDWWKIYLSKKGKLTVELDGPSNADFDLYVHKSCSSSWICRPYENDADEKCIIDADSGYYYINVEGYKGTGSYKLKASIQEKKEYDLAPASFITDPQKPSNEDYIDIGYSFVNLGPDGITDSFSTELTINGDFKGACILNNGLKFLEYSICEKKGIKLGAGTHQLKQKVDVNNQIAETDEKNNELTQSLAVTQPDYDLIVYDVDPVPSSVDDKSTFSLVAAIQNKGKDAINKQFKTTIKIYDGIVQTCTFNEKIVPNSIYICAKSGLSLSAGNYEITAEVDTEDDVKETNELNNIKKKSFPVFHLPEYDVDVSDIYTQPTAVNDKTTFVIKWDIKNTGKDPIQEIVFNSKLYVNGVLKYTCTHDFNSDTFHKGQTRTCSFGNQKWNAGTYKLRVEADTGNSLEETYESNNNREESFEVTEYCSIPDGSAADCECNSDKDCPANYFCNFKPGLDACVQRTCEDECNTAGYYCSNGDAYKCGNFDSDSCMDKKLLDICSANEKCEQGESSCTIDSSPVDAYAEDSGSNSITVYKQPGDTVELSIHSGIPQTAEFTAPAEFILQSGICENGLISLLAENTCAFEISESAADGSRYFRIKDAYVKIEVTSKPKTIIVTNRQKLNERFKNDPVGVKALLKQAFQFAHFETNTVVYYLDREIPKHPFTAFSSYMESILAPVKTDNKHSMDAARLITGKCGSCESIVILGDDFVVPFYRVDYATVHNWWEWWASNHTEVSYIYSDQPYIKENKKSVGEISTLFDSSEAGKVKLVVPDSMLAEVESKVNELKAKIAQEYGYGAGSIETIKSGSVGCSSYGKLDDATLILIGSREDNNAIKCVPWFDIGSKPTDTFKASIEVERNVWANNKYAIIVSGSDLASGLDNLLAIMNNSDYFEGTMLGSKNTVYIHDFSNPPEMPPNLGEIGDHVIGFALGKCEEGNFAGEKGACIATDMIAGVVPPTDIITDIRDMALYCPSFIWNKVTGQKGELFDGLVCGGSAAGTGITIGKYVTAVTGAGAVVGTVADGGSTALKTVLKVTKASLKGGADRMIKVFDKIQLFKFENARVFFKAGKDESTWSNVNKFVKITSENSKYINKYAEFFPEDALAATIKNVDDYEGMAVGTKRVLSNFQGGLDEFENAVKVCTSPCRAPTKAETAANIKNTGKAAIKGIPTVKLTELPKEAEDTVKLIENGGPFPFPTKDGIIHRNDELRLPSEVPDYYREFTVPTPSVPDRGLQRIVTGKNGEIYYSPDHYKTFKRVIKK